MNRRIPAQARVAAPAVIVANGESMTSLYPMVAKSGLPRVVMVAMKVAKIACAGAHKDGGSASVVLGVSKMHEKIIARKNWLMSLF